LKVVWLCAFANDEVAQKIGAVNHPIVSPWITDLIDLFRLKNDIELYVVSPNYYTNSHQNIFIDHINVILYKYRPVYIPKKAYNLSYNYKIIRSSVGEIVQKIQPDIIHLFGSENPLYAAGIFALNNKYPVLVTLQGFIHLSSIPSNIISKYIRWNRIRIERIINSTQKYFTYCTRDSKIILDEINPLSIKFDTYYPTTIPEVNAHDYSIKKYDLVYFARITKDKGIEDFIEAVNQLKLSSQNIKAVIIGGGNENYVQSLKTNITRNNLDKNITFAGFLAQQDVFKLAAQAKVYVLPTYFDAFPGSIRESMYMQLPVVAYNVGGIPYFNSQKECVTLAERKNIPDLVEKIKLVLNDKERTKRLVQNAYDLIKNRFDNNKIYSDWISIYNQILKDQTS
jgi:glycosyltransferase involved in cell wall biosynthesis